jgi:signal transduction histidine kinase/CheY-like chemotaxis protein
MLTSIEFSKQTDPEFQSALNELVQSTTSTLIYTVGGLYLAFLIAASIWPSELATNAWIIVPPSLALFGLALFLLPRRYIYAHVILQLGLAGSITLAVYLFQKPEIALFFAVLPLISVVCLGWRAGAAMEIIAVCLTIWIHQGLLVTPAPLVITIIVPLCGLVSGMLGWSSMRAVLMVTQWSLYSFHQAERNLTEARNHRAKLVQAVKELGSANIRLDRFNYMLAQARAEAEEAKDARNRFSLAISHELRTPLNFIISFSEIMTNNPETYAALTRWPANLYDDIREIYRSSNHLMRLVNDVLDLGQIENLRMNLIKEWVSLAQVVNEVSAMLQRAFELKKIELRIEVETDLPIVYVDRTRIRQVLLNLVNNSLRFTDHGSVTINLRRYGNDALLITVADTGSGITQEDLPRVFEEFQQVSKDSWRRREGTGLGIPISKRFIELHGGQMWAESKIDQGTRFYFTIPVSPVNQQASRIDNDQEGRFWRNMLEESQKGNCILVISKDPTAGEILAQYVEDFSLITMSLDEDFNARVITMLPQAIFLDQSVTQESEVIAKVNHLPYDIPIFCFPFPGNPAHPHDLSDCVRSYLVKPFSNQVLIDAILSLGPKVHKLLVVDDDPAMSTLVSRALSSRLKNPGDRQYQLDMATTGAEALWQLQSNCPDAILLDVTLPDISGWEILKEANGLAIPVIFITATEWPNIFPEHDMESLRILMRRPLNRNEMPIVLKNLLEVIRPKFPTDLNAIVRQASVPAE